MQLGSNMFSNARKSMFYYTLIIMLFIGSIAAVFRTDTEAKWVSVGSALISAILLVFSFRRLGKNLP
jgi:hypothetical protein